MENSEIKNRLIIVGNGFDLAHQFPTKYHDFIGYLLSAKFNRAYASPIGLYVDEYFVILKLGDCRFEPRISTTAKEFLRFKCENLYNANESNHAKIKESIKTNERAVSEIYFHVKDKFLNALMNAIRDYNWVDVEMEYYKHLIDVAFPDPLNILGSLVRYDIGALNKSFEMLKDEFIGYLRISERKHIFDSMSEIFDYKINYDFNHRRRRINEEGDERPKETLVLNFNYTETLDNYKYKYHWGEEISIVNIHGDIENKTNPVIFGYGDEIVESYKKLELKNDNEYLKFMKNKDYALTTNYSKLIAFIEQAPFEVYVLGHSCGISDRVMLNTIFEHEFCKSIFIFYHKKDDGTDNFMDVYHNISRQFSMSKRADLRKKVKAKEISMPLPQIKINQ